MSSVPKQIQLLGAPRSGTTYMSAVLARYLKSEYDDAVFFSEIFNPYQSVQSLGMIPGFCHEHPSTKRHSYPETGFAHIVAATEERLRMLENSPIHVLKNHINHFGLLQMASPAQHVNRLKSIPYYTIVILRKDIFQAALSYAIASVTKQWARYDQVENITIDLDEMKTRWGYIIHYVSEIISNVHNINYNEVIYYEDLTSSPIDDWANLDFINYTLDEYHAAPRLEIGSVSKAPDKRSYVTNYDELYDYTLTELVPATDQTLFQFDDTSIINISVNMGPNTHD